MNNLVILSRDHHQYRLLIESADLPDLVIIQSTENVEEIENLDDIHTLLAEPDLGAKLAPHCKNLRWFQSTWAGVKPITDLNAKSYLITGVKDVFGKQMREYVFTYLLQFSRKVAELKELQYKQQWLGTQVATDNLFGKTLGIIGVGSIGKEVAKLAKQFDMQVLGLTRNRTNCDYVDQYFHHQQLAMFASKLDYCVCLLPHTNITAGLLDDTFFSSLPNHAIFINAGRGQVVNHSALIAALQNNQLAGAVLDVFPEEPIPKNDPIWTTKNLLVTQHTSAISKPTDVGAIFVQNYQKFRTQIPLNYVVDCKKGY